MSLTLNTDIPPQHHSSPPVAQHAEQDTFQDRQSRRSRSQSPVRPPVSPISPTLPAAQLATPAPTSQTSSRIQTATNPTAQPSPRPASHAQPTARTRPAHEAHFIDPPAPLPINEEDNTDAAALRAAISILQIQKEKSRKDIKTLQDLRNGLIKDPDAFTQELLAGRLREEKRPDDPLQATFSESAKDDTDEDDAEPAATQLSSADLKQSPPSQFPKIPAAQNVIRCPPVNWAKYRIAGEPLDRMHQEQRTRPSLGEPATDSTLQPNPYSTPLASRPAAEHLVFAPYDPQRDKHTTPAEQMGIGVQTRRSSKKPDLGSAGVI